MNVVIVVIVTLTATVAALHQIKIVRVDTQHCEVRVAVVEGIVKESRVDRSLAIR